ncbi:hypothetical protein BGZ61DRAFT_560560 [Ilyonectria robusta]|uniref:uncharacterized protein n=1 Tax=Ilyonectria robusta TaxID=1079257 RepID=UPI001E8E265F|nr:uncharacterized protein BGZ61DRAFT_560560 [Ilyonectria robusta]KAH8734821.1 hypothetical protein BGZ61DRAFT_560560 [Ilyonectria robusta]
MDSSGGGAPEPRCPQNDTGCKPLTRLQPRGAAAAAKAATSPTWRRRASDDARSKAPVPWPAEGTGAETAGTGLRPAQGLWPPAHLSPVSALADIFLQPPAPPKTRPHTSRLPTNGVRIQGSSSPTDARMRRPGNTPGWEVLDGGPRLGWS